MNYNATESLSQGAARLSAGVCPDCGQALAALTPSQAANAAQWYAPPHAYCARCDAMAGWYPGEVDMFWYLGRTEGCAGADEQARRHGATA